MKKQLNIYFVIASLILCFHSISAQSQKNSAPAQKSTDEKVESIAIEELLPANTMGYLSANNLAGIKNNFQALDAYKAMQGRMPKKELELKDNPLNIAVEFISMGLTDPKALDEIRIGFALISTDQTEEKPAPGEAKKSTNAQPFKLPAPMVVTFLEGLHLDVVTRAREQFIRYYNETFVSIGKPDEIKTVTIKGVKYDRFKNGDLGLWIGATYIIGPQSALEKIYQMRHDRTIESLSEDQEFMRARSQLSPTTGLFAYVNGKPINQMFANLRPGQGGRGMPGLPEILMGSMMGGFSGLESIKNIAIASTFERDGIVDRIQISMDDSRKNIITNIFSGPANEFKATKYVPAGTQIVGSLSLDWMRFYDEIIVKTFYQSSLRAELIRQEMSEIEKRRREETPDESSRIKMANEYSAAMERVEAKLNGENSGKLMKEYEDKIDRELGIGLREEISKDLGTEILVAYEMPKNQLAGVNAPAEKKNETVIGGFIEIKNREAAKAALLKVIAYQMGGMGARNSNDEGRAEREKTDAEIKQEREAREKNMAAAMAMMPRENYKNAELISFGFFELGFTDKYLIIADSKATIKNMLDVYDGGRSIQEDFNYARAMSGSGVTNNFKLFISPKFFDDMLNGFIKSWVVKPKDLPEDLSAAAPLNAPATAGIFIENEKNRIKIESLSPLGIPGLIALYTFGSDIQSKTAQKENDVRYRLQELRKAEKIYAQKNNTSYASLEVLANSKITSFSPALVTGESENYRYEFKLKPAAKGYEITATPIEYGRLGRRSFYLDESGNLRSADKSGSPANINDEIDTQTKEVDEEAIDGARKAAEDAAAAAAKAAKVKAESNKKDQ